MLINAEEKDVLQELVNIGVGGAAVALSGIMNREVILTFPRLEIFDLEQMKQYLRNREDVQYVSVSQKVRGEFSGKGIISFTLQEGKTLLNILLDNPDSPDYNFGIMEKETIQEVGNILITAIFCSISDVTNTEASFELPELTVSNQILSIGDESENSLYCLGKVNFSVENTILNGRILFTLVYKDIKQIITKLLEI